MAVYERRYRLWTGDSTPQWSRFLILPKFSFREVFKSRWMLVYFILCFVWPLLSTGFVYLSHNADFLNVFPNFDLADILEIKPTFFHLFLTVQGWAAFGLAVFIGPGLVSKDLANNGLPLYLSRPFSRFEYVLGKTAVLGAMLLAVTLGAGLLLLTMHVNFEGLGWLADNWRIPFGLVFGSLAWVITLCLFSMALSAWVRWKVMAAFAMLALVLGGAGFGAMVNALFKTQLGSMINPMAVFDRIWATLLAVDGVSRMPATAAWISAGLFLAGSFLLLERKLRAYQVVT